MCGCGGGGRRMATAPKLPANQNQAIDAAKLHPNVVQMHNIQRLAEERRKVERLRREQLLKALAKP